MRIILHLSFKVSDINSQNSQNYNAIIMTFFVLFETLHNKLNIYLPQFCYIFGFFS